MYTIPLRLASWESVHTIGSKAKQLAKLAEVNITIPDGFVVTSTAFHRFMVDNGLLLDRGDEWFITRLVQADFPADLTHEISTAFATLQGNIQSSISVAVRSSSAAEDLQIASFAGQYETILNVTELPHIFESIKRCWTSSFSPGIQEYAQQSNIELLPKNVSMAVLIQQMIQADVSGVIFSMNPVTGNRDEIVINASYGLGESVVAGLVIPDLYYVHKNNGSTVRELGVKELKIVAAHQGTVQVETSVEEQGRFCLNDQEISKLVQQMHKIEAHFGRPVDIEFAIQNGRIYILQARPVTTLS